MITIQHLRKTYLGERGSVQAIKDFSLHVKKGSFVSLVGPSGCGKSTILKLCAGLLEADKGKIVLENGGVSSIVFQKPVLLPWKSVRENIVLPLVLEGKAIRGRVVKEIDKIISLVGLNEFVHSYPHELSGGMQQRVALAQALVRKPSLLLMDEPFSALDELLRERLNGELLAIWKRLKPTILFVTHSLQEAVYLSDKVVVLSKRPTVVKEEIEITLPRERGVSICETSGFQKYVRTIRGLLK